MAGVAKVLPKAVAVCEHMKKSCVTLCKVDETQRVTPLIDPCIYARQTSTKNNDLLLLHASVPEPPGVGLRDRCSPPAPPPPAAPAPPPAVAADVEDEDVASASAAGWRASETASSASSAR